MTALRALLGQWFVRYRLPRPCASHPLAIAYSGGLDSTVLLHAAHSVWPNAVAAVHVNHGLQKAAPAFEAHCVATCGQLSVPLTVMRADIQLQRGDSLEEQARLARYALLRQAAETLGAPVVWLAQHADDQAETVLLALSRGAGVAGLAGMGPMSVQGPCVMGRPLLALPQSILRACAVEQGWQFMDDPTNLDTRFVRNRIRHHVMPALTMAFPQLTSTIARSARHCAQADALLVELARLDLLSTGIPPALHALQVLSDARRANALRCWLRDAVGRAPSTAQLDELVKQVGAAVTRGHRIDIKVGAGRVVREGLRLAYIQAVGSKGCCRAKPGLE